MKKSRKYEGVFHDNARRRGESILEADIDDYKAHLCMAIRDTIEQHGLTQKEAASLSKVGVKTISNALTGNIIKFSTDKLIRILAAINPDTEFRLTITIKGVPLSK